MGSVINLWNAVDPTSNSMNPVRSEPITTSLNQAEHKQELELFLTPQVSWSRAGVRVNQSLAWLHTYCYAVIHPDQKTLLNYSYREKSMLICFVVLSTAVVGASLSSGEAQPFPERRAGDWALRESGSSKSLLWVLSHRLPGKTR